MRRPVRRRFQVVNADMKAGEIRSDRRRFGGRGAARRNTFATVANVQVLRHARMSKNFAKAGNGGKVLCATCFDPEHPVDNVLDGDLSTFWPTTGMHVRNMFHLPMVVSTTANARPAVAVLL